MMSSNSHCGPDIVKYFVVEPANDAVTGATGNFFVCSGTTFLSTISGCTDSVDFNGNTFYNSGDVFFNGVLTACTGIYTSNLYGCSPITVQEDLILLSGLTLSAITNDDSLSEILVRDSVTGLVKYRDVSSIAPAAKLQNTYFVSSLSGDNSTALVGDINNPWKTITEARNQAVADGLLNSLIHVYSGQYVDEEIQYENGNFYFEPNSIVTMSPTTVANRSSLFRLGISLVKTSNIYSATTCNVYGYGKFVVSASTDGGIGGAILNAGGDSTTYFEFDTINAIKGAGIYIDGFATATVDGGYIEVDTDGDCVAIQNGSQSIINIDKIDGASGHWGLHYSSFSGKSLVNITEILGAPSWQPIGFSGVKNNAEIVINFDKISHNPPGSQYMINNSSQTGGKITLNGNLEGEGNGIVTGLQCTGGEFNYNGDIITNGIAIDQGFGGPHSNTTFYYNGNIIISGNTTNPIQVNGGTVILNGSITNTIFTGTTNGVSIDGNTDLKIGNFDINVNTESITATAPRTVEIIHSLNVDKPLNSNITTTGLFNYTGTTNVGDLVIYNTPTNDNSLTQILGRNSTTGNIEYRSVESIITGATSQDTFVTGFTYNNANTFTISDNSGTTFNATINNVTGLTSNGNVEVVGNVIVTGGSGNVLTKQVYVENNLGLDWDFPSSSVVLGNNSDGTIINGTSLTVNGDTTINGSLSATTVSACTGIYTSNLYGCSPITVHDNLIMVDDSIIKATNGDGVLNLRFNSTNNVVQLDNDGGTYNRGWFFLEDARMQAGYQNNYYEAESNNLRMRLGTSTTSRFLSGDADEIQLGENIPLSSDGNPFKVFRTDGGAVTLANSAGSKVIALNNGVLTANTSIQQVVALGATGGTLKTNNTAYLTQTGFIESGDDFEGILNRTTLTADRTYTLPNKSGIVALVSDISGATDTFVTGFTFNNSTYDLTIKQNEGEPNLVSNLAVLASDVYVVSGVYNSSTGIVTYTNSSGGTFQVSGFTSGMTDSYTTDAYVDGTEIKFDNNIQGLNYYNVDLLPLLSGKTDNTTFNTYTANTQTILDGKIDSTNNVGGANEFFKDKSGTTLNFRTLSGGSNTTVSTVGNVVKVDVTIPTDSNTFVTGFTYDNINTFTISDNSGSTFNAIINVLSATTISATTYFGDGSNLTGISTDDNYVTGGTLNSGTLTLDRQNGSVTITGFTTDLDTFVTGGTYNPVTVNLDFSGNTGFSPFSVDVSALKDDTNTFVTGFTYNDNNTFTIFDNDGGSFPATINQVSGLTVNGTLSATTYFGDGSNLTGISTDDNYVTGGTFSTNTLTLNRQNGSVTITGFTSDSNTFVTGYTYNDANTFTISNNDGSNYSALINTMTGLTINGESTGTTLTVNGQSVFSGNSTDVVQIYGSGSTSPIFRIQGSAGELFSVTDSLVGELFAVNDISGIPILQVHSDNRIILGDNLAPSLYTTAKVTANSGSLTSIYSIPLSAYTGAWFEYTAKGSSSLRAGNIASIFSGTSVNHNETTTTDIGDTSDLLLDVIISGTNATLTASATTSNWEIKTIIRSI